MLEVAVPKHTLIEFLEIRALLNAAYDLVGITALRSDPNFSNIDGRGVSVAVIDTGLDISHPLISPNYRAGADIVTGASTPTVTNPHGTHVAGIVGSKPDASRGYEGGVATGTGLIGLQVFTQGGNGEVGADNRSIERALQWVIDHRTQYNIVAVNMSLGGGFYTSPSQVAGTVYVDEIDELEDAGVTIVSTAGNSYGIVQNSSTGQQVSVEYPNSGAPGIVSTLNIGAVWETNEGSGFFWGNGSVDLSTAADRVTSFSQRPPVSAGNALFAPGALITSTYPNNQLQQSAGTSQASPMVAGAVALMQNAAMTFGGRLLSPAEVRNILQNTGDTIVDGDNEDDAIFVDSNSNGQVDSGELFTLKNTGVSYKRMNVHNALKSVRQMFVGGGGTVSGDPNGTISGAILGPTLTGAPVDPTAGVLGSDGSTVIGNRDVDMFQFTLAAGGQVTIEVASNPASPADFNSFLRLFDSSGNQLAFDDNNGVGDFSQIQMNLSAGTYFAGVSGSGNSTYNPITGAGLKAGKSGNFRIGFSLTNVDPNGLLAGAVQVDFTGTGGAPATFNGFIGSDYGNAVGVSDVDLFKVVIPDNGKLAVDVDTAYDSGFVDSYLRVFDSSGNQIGASDDDVASDFDGNALEFSDGTFHYDSVTSQAIGHTSDSFVIGTVSRGDVYYFGVSDFNNSTYNPANLVGRATGGTGGSYDIAITFANNDQNGAIAQAVDATTLPASFNGTLGADFGEEVGDRDVDIFKLRPTANGILEIAVSSYSDSGNTSPVDTVIKLFDGTGALLASSNDVNGPDPLLQISVPKNRNYYVAVAGKGNDSFDPFVLGSGSPGAVGNYFISMQLRSSSLASSLQDDRIGDGAVRTVTLGELVAGSVGADSGFARGSADVDLFRFVAPSSGQVEIRSISPDAFGADTFLRLFDASGNEISFNDNADSGTVNTRIQASVTGGQTYFIGVNGAGADPRGYDPVTGLGAAAGSTGEYVLQIDGLFASVVSGELVFNGSAGNDTMSVTSTSTKLKAVRNGSTLIFSKSPITRVSVDAGAGNDNVAIGSGVVATYILGGDGNDLLNGGDGNDTLTSGAGKNTLFGNNGNDRLNGSGGRDALYGGAGDDRLYGNGGNDTLDGGGNVDRLFAGDGDDNLIGGGSNDKLYGDAGNDTLTGNAGADLMDGGVGTDAATDDGTDSLISIEQLL